MKKIVWWVTAIGFLVSAHEGLAQPAFEVASVKPVDDIFGKQLSVRVDHGNLTARFGLQYLIAWAYGVPFQQVVAPDWARLASSEIEAKAGSPVAEDQVRLMLRTLLADRFKLKVHLETKETRIFALTVGKGGPRLKASESQDRWRRQFDDVSLREIFTGVTMAQCREFLAQYFNGCLDRTGITGRYDFVLDYKSLIDPDAQSQVVREVIRLRPEALKQIGLTLQPVTAPLELVVVDHVEKIPTEN